MERVLKDRRFTEGLRLFDSGQFFEAHEEWEDLWRDMEKDNPYRDFVRGLIMVAAAYHKFFVHENPRGATGLFRKAFDRLDRYDIPQELRGRVEKARSFYRKLLEDL